MKQPDKSKAMTQEKLIEKYRELIQVIDSNPNSHIDEYWQPIKIGRLKSEISALEQQLKEEQCHAIIDKVKESNTPDKRTFEEAEKPKKETFCSLCLHYGNEMRLKGRQDTCKLFKEVCSESNNGGYCLLFEQSPKLTAEEILVKVCRFKNIYELEDSDDITVSEALEAMCEFKAQGIDWENIKDRVNCLIGYLQLWDESTAFPPAELSDVIEEAKEWINNIK